MRPTLRLGSKGVDVVDWQLIVGAVDDGFFGPVTESLTRSWQRSRDLIADGIVGPSSWAMAEGKEETTMASIAHVKGIERLNIAQLKALVQTANAIGINPDWLAAVISFETIGTFSPSEVNRSGSGAVGLIQFLPVTAKRLLHTKTEKEAVDQLKSMTFARQLEIVRLYFQPYVGRLKNLEDTYLAVFYPAEIGKSPSDIIARSDDPETERVYNQNRGFDTSDKGYITREDVTKAITSTLNRAIALGPRIQVPVLTTGAAIATGLATYGLYKLYTLKNAR